MDILAQTYLSDILHAVSQGVLIPVIVALLALIFYAVWSIGSVIVEYRTERRHFAEVMPCFLSRLSNAAPADIPAVIGDAKLLGSQKHVLLTLWDHRTLPVDTHIALAKRLMDEQQSARQAQLQRTESIVKISPMLGLMGTLIPLGPGIVSLGTGDTYTLSSSLLVAFDTTVAGLIVAVVAFIISKVRKNWYEDYTAAIEAGMTAILEKVEGLREAGAIDVSEPTDFAALYEPVRKAKEGRR